MNVRGKGLGRKRCRLNRGKEEKLRWKGCREILASSALSALKANQLNSPLGFKW
jgi:hypothetical protein